MFNILSDNDFIKLLLHLIGGLGIFLYGINLLGESLKTLAGDKMKSIIEKLTNNVFKGILIGFLVTAILQSSSGTTALSISLIRAGLMTMPQAIGIIMGANIGTTATAFLFSFPKISDYSLLLIGIGALLIFFIRNKKIKLFGQALLGFGLLFYGMELMSDGLKVVVTSPEFGVGRFLSGLDQKPWIALLTGAGITALVQSSSATTVIVQRIFETGKLSLHGALPILFGNNIGTTITAILAAIGGSIASRRASLFHVIFNIFGALLFMILLTPFYNLIEYIVQLTNASPRMTIAYAHLIFNIVNTLVLVWFIKHIIWSIKKIIPGEDDLSSNFSQDTLNDLIIKESPVMALESSKKAIIHMANMVQKMLKETIHYSKTNTIKVFDEVKSLEAIINTLDRKIHHYLVKITPYVYENDTKELSKYLDTIRDLERIGDHCENILEVFEYIHDNKGFLSNDAWEDLDEMFNTVSLMLDYSITIIESNDQQLAEQVIKIEDKVDKLEKKLRKHHTKRVNNGICTSEIGINFIELLSNLERIGDHCCNIAEYSINEEYYIFIDEFENKNINKDTKIIIKENK